MSPAMQAISEYFAANGRQPTPLSPQMRIMGDLGIDSLGLAEIVIAMEQRTGRDPFANGFREFETIAELDALYQSE